MFEETLFQKAADGTQFVDVLKKQDIIPGIKVDTGLQMIAGTDGETATQGLDGLGERCRKYYAQGARFGEWALFGSQKRTTWTIGVFWRTCG